MSPQALRIDAARYVGLRFLEGGRDRNGCDCFGLVRLVLRDLAGVTVDLRGDTSAGMLKRLARGMLPEACKNDFVEVLPNAARDLDVVLMTGRPLHLGIVIGDGILHCDEVCDAVFVQRDHASVRDRIMRFYRHREMLT